MAIIDQFTLNPGQIDAQKALLSTATDVLLTSGAGSGKSRVIMEYMHNIAAHIPGSNQLVLRRERVNVKSKLWDDVWQFVLRSKPGLEKTLKINLADLTVQYPNGSVIRFGGLGHGEARDKILGGTYLNVFLNEATDFNYQDYMAVGTRARQVVTYTHPVTGAELTAQPKMISDCNPTLESHFLCRLFRDRVDPVTRVPLDNGRTHLWVKMHPWQNKDNLGASYIARLEGFSPAERRRYLDGEWGVAVDDALFPESWVHEHRIEALPSGEARAAAILEWRTRLARIIVACDPAVTASDKSDETGIVVVGIDHEGRGYVLEDLSCKAHPESWGRAVIAAYHRWQADKISVEGNQGRELLRTLLESIDPTANVHLLNAKTSKVSRAEPVANLYFKGMIHHVGEFPQLEDQMFSLESNYKKTSHGKSPDRVDALVWGITDLMINEANMRTGGGGSSQVGGLWG